MYTEREAKSLNSIYKKINTTIYYSMHISNRNSHWQNCVVYQINPKTKTIYNIPRLAVSTQTIFWWKTVYHFPYLRRQLWWCGAVFPQYIFCCYNMNPFFIIAAPDWKRFLYNWWIVMEAICRTIEALSTSVGDI